MAASSLLTTYFKKIGQLQGSGICIICASPHPKDTAPPYAIDKVRATVRISLPITCFGKVVTVEAEYTEKISAETHKIVSSNLERHLQGLRMRAYKGAVEELVKSIAYALHAARPTVTQRRIKKRTNAILRAIGSQGFVEV